MKRESRWGKRKSSSDKKKKYFNVIFIRVKYSRGKMMMIRRRECTKKKRKKEKTFPIFLKIQDRTWKAANAGNLIFQNDCHYSFHFFLTPRVFFFFYCFSRFFSFLFLFIFRRLGEEIRKNLKNGKILKKKKIIGTIIIYWMLFVIIFVAR